MAYSVKITWGLKSDEYNLTWSETCARIMEQFGLPGDRYTTEINSDYMIFNFKTQEDAVMATLMVGNQAR
jgi:hypothetical protein